MNKKVKNVPFYEFHKTYGFWGKRNIFSKVRFRFPQSIEKLIDVSHNSIGIREKEIGKKIKSKRILCFGGSNTWGAGMEDKNRYSNLLNSHPEYESFNFGQCSFSLEQIYLLIKKVVKEFKTDLVIIEQYPWSLTRSINPFVNGYIRPLFLKKNNNFKQIKIREYYKIKLVRDLIGNYLKFKKEFKEYYNEIHFFDKQKKYIDPIYKKSCEKYYFEMYEIVEYVVRFISDFCKKNNIKLLFLVTPTKDELLNNTTPHEIDYSLPRSNLIKILKKNQINFVDVSKEFKSELPNSSPIFLDGHANEKGHSILAKSILSRYL